MTAPTAFFILSLLIGGFFLIRSVLANSSLRHEIWNVRCQLNIANGDAAERGRERDSACFKMDLANTDADRLAAQLQIYVNDIDSIAAKLQDKSPPSLAPEREALRLHDAAVKLRTK